jgi:hypothetical protein
VGLHVVLTPASGFAEWRTRSLALFLLLLTELHHKILFFAAEVIVVDTGDDRVEF